jgi:hypothetical protein
MSKEKLQKISGELKKASKMHAGQAQKVDNIVKRSGFKMKGFSYPGQSPMTFKGANSKNSGCWEGYRKVGTKPSPSGTGETVNDCVKIK